MSKVSEHTPRWRPKGQMSEALITAVFLTLAGGMLDAYGYLLRDGVFANAETGNIVLMGIAAFKFDWPTAGRYLMPIIFFALGVPAANAVRTRCKQNSRLHWRQVVLAIEIVTLFVVGFIPKELNILANCMVGLTCSMQVQAFRKVDGHPFASTMCTGNLRSGMDALYGYLQTRKQKSLDASLHYFGIILIFALGAGLGVVIMPSLGFKSIWIAGLLLLISFSLMFINDEVEELAEEIEVLEEHVAQTDALNPKANSSSESH